MISRWKKSIADMLFVVCFVQSTLYTSCRKTSFVMLLVHSNMWQQMGALGWISLSSEAKQGQIWLVHGWQISKEFRLKARLWQSWQTYCILLPRELCGCFHKIRGFFFSTWGKLFHIFFVAVWKKIKVCFKNREHIWSYFFEKSISRLGTLEEAMDRTGQH